MTATDGASPLPFAVTFMPAWTSTFEKCFGNPSLILNDLQNL